MKLFCLFGGVILTGSTFFMLTLFSVIFSRTQLYRMLMLEKTLVHNDYVNVYCILCLDNFLIMVVILS